MELELELTHEIGAQQTMRVSPRLVAANYILELSSQELQQQIADELNDNPALELVDVPLCQSCGTELERGACPRCVQRREAEDHAPDESSAAFNDESFGSASARTLENDEFDPLTLVASEETLAERLISDLGAIVDESEMAIAEYLVGSLDDKGYLSTTIDEAAYELDVDESRVSEVLRHLQALEPVGVGARSLRECMLIQIDYLEQLGIRQPHAREIVSAYLVELGEHKFAKIAHELGISDAEVAEVWQFVKAKLNPHPAHGFSPTNARDRDTRAMYVLPDVIISKTEDGFSVEVVESRRFALRISPPYTKIAAEAREAGSELSDDEKRHVSQYVGRAKMFIANVDQRRRTIFNITSCLVEHQSDFLENGIRHLKPLRRAAIADQLGIHESTVSRATASKYVMLPDGEVIPCSHFFTPSLSIKDVIKEMVEKEGHPLTDAQIAVRLRQRGIEIARRTVAKYRMQLDILPSSLRG